MVLGDSSLLQVGEGLREGDRYRHSESQRLAELMGLLEKHGKKFRRIDRRSKSLPEESEEGTAS